MQANYTCVPQFLRDQHCNLAPVDGVISLAGTVASGLVKSNGTEFMTNVTCGLTVKKPGSVPSLTLVIEYGTTLLFGFVGFTAMHTLQRRLLWGTEANYIFTARRYASAVLAVIVCLSVCLSVRQSVRHKSELYKDG